MANDLAIESIVTNLVLLQNAYAKTPRAVITKERHQALPWRDLHLSLYDCPALHEPLIEHVGHLPIIATNLHPKLEQSRTIDLGKALIMLAVHDIGETITGDVPSYNKTGNHTQEEYKAAQSLLTNKMWDYFIEYENNRTLEAKFAKSIDILSPMLHHLSHLDVAAELYQHLNADLITLWQRKRKYMEWDALMVNIFDYCVKTIRPTLLG